MNGFEYDLLDFKVFENVNFLCEKQLVIWGAAPKGRQAYKTLKRMGIHIAAFCDSDVNKWGTLYEDVPIISPYKLKEYQKKDSQICIISCVFRENELLKTMQELEFGRTSFLSYWGLKTAFVSYGITLEPEGNLPIYDEAWRYEAKCHFENIPNLKFLRNIQMAWDSNAVWNFQPGKVASSTVAAHLKHVDIPIVQLYSLTCPSGSWESSLINTVEEGIRNRLSQGVKIITGVREPLSRDYSAFWQLFSDDRSYLLSILDKDFQKMYKNYAELIMRKFNGMEESLRETLPWIWTDEFEWFNQELKKHCGIDIYKYPFDKEKGYSIIRQNNVQVFVYKTEKLNDIMPALGEFLGTSLHIGENINQAEGKIYHLAYKEFQKNIRLPLKYVEHYYKNNAYMNHFYTAEEQEKFLRKWAGRIEND